MNQIKKNDRIQTRFAEWSACASVAIALVVVAGPGNVMAEPSITNLAATQRAGTKLVDITYDVAAPGFPSVMVSLQISSDAGATWTVPSSSATGHVGSGVVPGTGKAIVWDAATDWSGNYSTQMRFRLVLDDGFAMIPAGSFTMGRTSGDADTEAPPITVTVSGFYLAETETTYALWDEIRTWALTNGYTDLAAGWGKAPDHPVQTLTWWDAVKWCNARSEMEGLAPVYTVGGNVMRTGTTAPNANWGANGYRLPTEAEWEKAARGGVSGKRYPWGSDTISHSEANYRANGTWYGNLSGDVGYHPTHSTGYPYTSPVGSFSGNGFGLKDMAGNVFEWCWDFYVANYYTLSNGTTNPRGPASGSYRVWRGGAWGNDAYWARASHRGYNEPTFTDDQFGFRVARISIPDLIFATTGDVSADTRSNDANLSALTLSSGVLGPIFAGETTNYTADVPFAQTSITVTPTKAEINATIEARINNGPFSPVISGSPTGSLDLNVGPNLIEIRVTAQNGVTQKTYSISVYVFAFEFVDEFNDTVVDSSQWLVNLSPPGASVAESGGSLTTTNRGSVFAKKDFGGVLEISGIFVLNNHLEHFNIAARSNGEVISGDPYHSRSGINVVFSNDGNAISIQEFRVDGTITILAEKGYTLTTGTPYAFLFRLDGSNLSLSVNGVQELTAVSSYSAGEQVGFYSREGFGTSTSVDAIRIRSGTSVSNHADLSALTLSSGVLDPTFANGTTAYTAFVPFSQTSISVTPTKAEANATIEVRANGGTYAAVASGSPSGSLSLNVGTNPIDIRVTAQNESTQTTYTVAVTRAKGEQNITFAAITDKEADESIDLSATGGASSNPVTFAVTTGPASINGSNQLTFTGAGSVTITASQAGNAEYDPAPDVPRTFNVTKATATVNLTGLTQTYDGSPRVVEATTVPSGKTVNLSYAGSSTPPTDAGSYAIVATIDDPIYQGVRNSTLTVNKASQAITFGAITDKLANAVVNLSATGGASGNPVTFAVTNGPASINGSNQLTFTGAGSVTVTASQAGNTNYNAATPVPRTFNVTKAGATVSITDSIQVYNGTPRSVTVTTSPPGLAHTVAYLGQPGPPTNVGIYGVNATITDPRYDGFDGADLMIQKAPQTINFATPPDTVETAVLNLSATGGGSGNTVTFAVTNGPAFLSGPAQLRFNGAGSVTITASQAGNSNYFAATPVARTFLVDDSTAGITISDLLQVADGTPHSVSVATDPPGLNVNVTYNGSANPPVAAGRYTVVATVDDALYDGTEQETFILDDPGVLIRVPGGFLPQRSSLGPLQVETFQIGRYEVTWGLWKTVRDWAVVNGYQFDPIAAGCADNHPVRRIKWFDAVKWCNARTEWENATRGRSFAPVYRLAGEVYRSGIHDPATILADETAGGYRLPTAVEWEFAARGGDDGTDTQFPGGNDLLPLAWFRDNSTGAACNLSNGRGTWPVGEKSPNELGIFDLAGNVIEWTWTPIPGSLNQRFSLGGSWDSDAAECQIGALYDNGVTYTDIRYGFRVGRSIADALTVALDDEQRAWDSSGAQPWFAQTGTTHDGIDAAESGEVYPGEESRLETILNGPGNLSFRWKAASVEGADEVAFYVGTSSLEGSLTGATDWEEFNLEIPGGERPVSWVFRRHPHSPAGPTRVWVDQVVYTPVTAPSLTTAPASDVTTTGATLGGNVTDDGGREVTERGIVWSTDPDPTVEEDTVVTGGTGTGVFTVPVSGLTGGTTYHVRAFATNNVGTTYGAPVVFTTRTTVAFTDDVATYDRNILPGDGHVFDLTRSGPRFVSFSTTGGAPLRAELRDAEGNVIAVFEGDTDFDLDELLYEGGYSLRVYRLPGEGEAQSYTLVIDASVVAATRPDVAVGTSPTALIGRGVYSPAAQLVPLTSRRAGPVTGYASVANLGNLPDVLSVGGTRGTPLFAVAYFGPQGNITASLLARSYRTPELNINSAPVFLRATIKPNKRSFTRKIGKRSVILRRTHDVIFQAGSTFDPAITDAATIRVQTR